MSDRFRSLRKDYPEAGLEEAELDPDPLAQFSRWFTEAEQAAVSEPNAMVVATADPYGRPSARVMLLKGLDADGFVFYSNYGSRKGEELIVNPRAALVFFWSALFRQVRVEGVVTRVDVSESDAYFASRPHGAQIAAAVSRQSRVVADRAALEEAFAATEASAGDRPVPRPPEWGGYRLAPDLLEFWQGRPNRLHDRLVYRREDGGWAVERLYP